MEVQIEKVKKGPIKGFSCLREASEREGFRSLLRLEEEWQNGTNTFSQPGEALFTIWGNGSLIGIGGINQDPYSRDKEVGRLRRFYIMASFRGQGIGSMLLLWILKNHWGFFEEIRLRTDSEKAAKFYERHGFQKVKNDPTCSHKMLRDTNFGQKYRNIIY
jgi:GNAT superfamily N-acetyltransferase